LHEFSDWTVYSVLLEAAVHMKKNNLFCDEEKTAE